MENSNNLVQNFGYLCTRLDNLKLCRDQVIGRRQPEMEGWLQKVKGREDEVDKLRRELDELNGGHWFKAHNAKQTLNKKVLENLRVVERLKDEFNAGSGSVNSSLDKVAKRYSSGEIKKFTSRFLKSKLSGNDGDIYTGQFDDKEVAVKVLPKEYVVDEIFITEVNTIARASHRYVVKLYGFCFEGDMRALVYEYIENGPFDRILYENHLNLEWETLYNIATETAKGILYLHKGCGEQIIHHDIRAHNVLLNKDLSPSVTGFGLAKLLARDKSDRTWTRTRGVYGYAAPEMWLPASRITPKCDVYSFGVMLFEILGKRTNGIGRNCFSNQVWEKFKDGQLDQILMDCGIAEKDRRKATVLTTLALWCVQTTPEIRPFMSEVVTVLENEVLVKSPPNPFQHQPSLPSPLIPRGISSTIHESFLERAEEFVLSSSSAPSLMSTSCHHLNDIDNSGTSILLRSDKAMEILEQFPRKCPPGGENSVIYYTTTIKNMKRPFKESNDVRSILQSHEIEMIERDVWGDVNYDDELEDLMGGPVIPVVFVKGRLIGGAREVKMLEAEGGNSGTIVEDKSQPATILQEPSQEINGVVLEGSVKSPASDGQLGSDGKETVDARANRSEEDVIMLDGETLSQVESIKGLMVERTEGYDVPQLERLYTLVVKGALESKAKDVGEQFLLFLDRNSYRLYISSVVTPSFQFIKQVIKSASKLLS